MATILIVDDHTSSRQLLVTLLGYKGHRVVEAADGAEGLVVARAERPDLVISDILMPTMDGYEFVRLLRADPALAQTPVVFWSVIYLEHEARALARACGVSHILVKPCDPQEVLRTVDAVLGHAPTPAAVLPPEGFDHEHLRLVTDELSQKVEELRTTNFKLDALIAAGQRLALERDLPQLLHDYCRAARDIIGVRWVAIGMLDADGHTCNHFVTAGLSHELTATISPPQFHQGIFREVLHARGALQLHGLPGDPQAAGLPPGYPPVHSLLGATIFSSLCVYGGICFADKLGDDAFSADDERLATTLAAQLGVAYENARLYTAFERRTTALEQEVAERERAEKGLTVRLLFPIAASQGERDIEPAEVEASAPPRRILVVDDDPLLRRLLQDVLQTEGHVVTVVEGGRAGLEALQDAQERQEPFEVVITDLGMPEMDSREVARGVKRVAPDTPVIMLTGWGQALRQDDALPPYVDLLLSKPPGLRELRAALRTVTRLAGRKDNHDNT